MNADDLVLDGNGMAGLLEEAMAADPTTLLRQCQGCGGEYALGAHRAFRGAGVVLRCPGCGVAAVIVGVQEQRLVVEVRGTLAVSRRP
jgi:Family of unknown function (DUF6510)